MATPYAALVSLMNVLNRVQHPTCPATFDKTQIQSLFDKVSLLVELFETHSQYISKDLQERIADAAYAAQDKIETCVVFRIQKRDPAKREQLFREIIASTGYEFLCQDLEETVRGMDLIVQEAVEVKQRKGEKNQPSRSTLHVGSSEPPSGTIKFAGFQDEVNRLLEQLATDRSSLQILPVIGMGGIGKSTLVVSVYNSPYVRDTFHFKAWVKISPVYDIGTIIRPLLHDFGVRVKDDEPLGDQLHKCLFGRKYLIVLDDIWDSEAWEVIGRFLPNNNNGSRVLLTTRLLNVAHTVGSCRPYEMQLLDDERSWDLLSKEVFGLEVCPSELEKYGKEIARSCEGLPLAIVVVGGMLKLSDRTLEYWAYVAENTRSIISQEDEKHCLKILSLSYHELPIHLCPCFLYMATFPRDYEIRVSELITLWAADGFLKPNGGDSSTLEEVALENLKELIHRNLIMVKKLDSRGQMKYLVLHDLIRDLCLREAFNERFLCVDDGVRTLKSQHRLVIHRSGCVSFRTPQQKRLARSSISFSGRIPPKMPLLSLLRVIFGSSGKNHPKYITQLANLRFIKSTDENSFLFFCDSSDWPFGRTASLVSSISFLWNLESLIVKVPSINITYRLPCEIWELPHIKHLIFSGGPIHFPDPPAVQTDTVLSNIQTLKEVIISSNEVLCRIPSIKDLGIQQDIFKEVPAYFWSNLLQCRQLETLNLQGTISFAPNELNTVKLFPDHLRKLSLSHCRIPCERMAVVGSLPNLQVLKLKWDAFVGEEWNSTEGEFQSLKILSIVSCDVADWSVENSSHFPCLEFLSLRTMLRLREVPQVFGESMTLKSIRLKWCDSSVVISAKQILDEQESMGYDDLIVEAIDPWLDNKEQEAELKSLASDRFHVRINQVASETS